ncbi:MAG: DNA polymerase III subunit delta' [Acidobacteria bacterium]|nr:DNA polymerase III subunit delta' [Acidobacteriota bacterium]
MSFAKLVGNQVIKEWIQKAIRQKRIPHSLVFTGQRGVGKQTFALEFAKTLNCKLLDSELNSCDKCVNCQRITTGQFADTRIITPDGQFIKIEQVRSVIEEVYYRPFEGNYRIYIFENAERMREQAANALLKTLEEPPSTSIIILITSSLDSLLPTIQSRTIKLAFSPIPSNTLKNYLDANYTRPEKEQNLLVNLAQGSIGKALSIDITEYLERRKYSLEILEAIVKQKSQKTRLLKLAESLGRKERKEFDLFLETLFLLLSDLSYLQISLDMKIINFDITDYLVTLVNHSSRDLFINLSNSLMALERDLPRNINRQMALEKIFLNL